MSILSFFRNYIWKTTTPWAKLDYSGESLIVRDFNKAFADKQRMVLGVLSDGKSDEEVVQIFVDRENLKHEEPELKILHMGIQEDGRVKMQFDWNQSFINHLMQQGFTGESEDDIIKSYLDVISNNALEDMEMRDEQSITRDDLQEIFADQDRELQRELDEAQDQIRSARRSKRK